MQATEHPIHIVHYTLNGKQWPTVAITSDGKTVTIINHLNEYQEKVGGRDRPETYKLTLDEAVLLECLEAPKIPMALQLLVYGVEKEAGEILAALVGKLVGPQLGAPAWQRPLLGGVSPVNPDPEEPTAAVRDNAADEPDNQAEDKPEDEPGIVPEPGPSARHRGRLRK